jgi:GntR family transcriptional regulator
MTIETSNNGPEDHAVKKSSYLARISDLVGESEGAYSHKIPKYLRLSNALLTTIETGYLRVGDQLPSELDIADVLKVSHGTVRRALETLVQQGVVVRSHGSGTFVAGGRQSEEDLWVLRFLRDDGKTLMPVFSHIVSIHQTTEKGPWSELLGGDDSFICINRIMGVGNEFKVFVEFYATMAKCRELLDCRSDELNISSLRVILGERFNMPTLRLEQRLQCRYLEDDICDILELKHGTTGVVLEAFEYTYRDAPVSFRRIFLPPGHRYLALPEKRL